MGVNLVIVDGNTKIDLTTDTVTAGTLKKGATAHNAAGDVITGTMEAEGVTIERETNSGGGETVTVTGEVNDNADFIACIERSDAGASITSLPAGVTSIGTNAFSNWNQLALTSLPEGVTVIGYGAFIGCYNLALTTIPAGVKIIDEYAFLGTGLTSLTFKGTPTSMADNIFAYCEKITDIYVPWAEGAVDNAPWGAANATVHYNSEV